MQNLNFFQIYSQEVFLGVLKCQLKWVEKCHENYFSISIKTL